MGKRVRRIGFDRDRGTESDVCNGDSWVLWGRCYGTGQASGAAAVGPVVDGIHGAHMLSAAKHFPGHGDTSVSSETQLPQINESLASLRARDWPPFVAAAQHGTAVALPGHRSYPAIQRPHPPEPAPRRSPRPRTGGGCEGWG